MIRAACERYQAPCVRDTIDTIHIGDAVINLRQLQRAMDSSPISSQSVVADVWVETAIVQQSECKPQGHISTVFPHIRPPPDQADLPWAEPIANGRLMSCLVYDEKHHLRHLNPINIANFNFGVKGLQERATINLALRSPYRLQDCVPHPVHPNVWLVSKGDGHDAARILMADRLANSAVVAWVPHRDLLMFSTLTISELGDTAAALRQECIERAQASKHPITAEAFRVDHGTVVHLPFRRTDTGGQLNPPV